MPRDEFEAYWKAVRKTPQPKNVPRSEDLVSLRVLHTWSQDDHPIRTPYFVVSGGERRHLYNRIRTEDWMFESPGSVHLRLEGDASWPHIGIENFLTERVREVQIPPEYRKANRFFAPLPDVGGPWELLWSVSACNYLDAKRVEFYLNHTKGPALTAYTQLVERREKLRSGTETWEALAADFDTWLRGCSSTDRLEVVLFLLTLAKNNQLIGSVLLTLDDVESLTLPEQFEDLYKFLSECMDWTMNGCLLRIILGWRGAKEDERALRKAHPQLAKRLTFNKKWVLAQSKDALL